MSKYDAEEVNLQYDTPEIEIANIEGEYMALLTFQSEEEGSFSVAVDISTLKFFVSDLKDAVKTLNSISK